MRPSSSWSDGGLAANDLHSRVFAVCYCAALSVGMKSGKTHTHLLVLRGAGTNACYAEQVSRIRKLPDNYQPRTEEMCINTEWGSFDADCLPLMIEDR